MTNDKDTLNVKFDGNVLALRPKPLYHNPKTAGTYYAANYSKFTNDGIRTYFISIFVTDTTFNSKTK